MTTPAIAVVTPEDFPMSGVGRLDNAQMAWITTLLDEHGFVLFRGYEPRSAIEFHDFIDRFSYTNFAYEQSFSNALRAHRTVRVFTANEAPPSVEIYLHHEMAQTLTFPSRLFFFCEQAADSGGATPICRSDTALAALDERCPDFTGKLRDAGVRYRNAMPAWSDRESGQGRSWRDTLGVQTKADAEDVLGSLGYDCRWLQDDALSVQTPVLPAIEAFGGGREVFFNQIVAAAAGWNPSEDDNEARLCFGDGSMMDSDHLQIAIDTCYEHSVDLRWQTGEIALLDNLQVMHGRRPFAGTRSILASLGAPLSRAMP